MQYDAGSKFIKTKREYYEELHRSLQRPMETDEWISEAQRDTVRGIVARQAGRHSDQGPQPGQQTASMAAFLFARQDIDELLSIVLLLADSRSRWIESAEKLWVAGQEQAAGR